MANSFRCTNGMHDLLSVAEDPRTISPIIAQVAEWYLHQTGGQEKQLYMLALVEGNRRCTAVLHPKLEYLVEQLVPYASVAVTDFAVVQGCSRCLIIRNMVVLGSHEQNKAGTGLAGPATDKDAIGPWQYQFSHPEGIQGFRVRDLPVSASRLQQPVELNGRVSFGGWALVCHPPPSCCLKEMYKSNQTSLDLRAAHPSSLSSLHQQGACPSALYFSPHVLQQCGQMLWMSFHSAADGANGMPKDGLHIVDQALQCSDSRRWLIFEMWLALRIVPRGAECPQGRVSPRGRKTYYSQLAREACCQVQHPYSAEVQKAAAALLVSLSSLLVSLDVSHADYESDIHPAMLVIIDCVVDMLHQVGHLLEHITPSGAVKQLDTYNLLLCTFASLAGHLATSPPLGSFNPQQVKTMYVSQLRICWMYFFTTFRCKSPDQQEQEEPAITNLLRTVNQLVVTEHQRGVQSLISDSDVVHSTPSDLVNMSDYISADGVQSLADAWQLMALEIASVVLIAKLGALSAARVCEDDGDSSSNVGDNMTPDDCCYQGIQDVFSCVMGHTRVEGRAGIVHHVKGSRLAILGALNSIVGGKASTACTQLLVHVADFCALATDVTFPLPGPTYHDIIPVLVSLAWLTLFNEDLHARQFGAATTAPNHASSGGAFTIILPMLKTLSNIFKNEKNRSFVRNELQHIFIKHGGLTLCHAVLHTMMHRRTTLQDQSCKLAPQAWKCLQLILGLVGGLNRKDAAFKNALLDVPQLSVLPEELIHLVDCPVPLTRPFAVDLLSFAIHLDSGVSLHTVSHDTLGNEPREVGSESVAKLLLGLACCMADVAKALLLTEAWTLLAPPEDTSRPSQMVALRCLLEILLKMLELQPGLRQFGMQSHAVGAIENLCVWLTKTFLVPFDRDERRELIYITYSSRLMRLLWLVCKNSNHTYYTLSRSNLLHQFVRVVDVALGTHPQIWTKFQADFPNGCGTTMEVVKVMQNLTATIRGHHMDGGVDRCRSTQSRRLIKYMTELAEQLANSTPSSGAVPEPWVVESEALKRRGSPKRSPLSPKAWKSKGPKNMCKIEATSATVHLQASVPNNYAASHLQHYTPNTSPCRSPIGSPRLQPKTPSPRQPCRKPGPFDLPAPLSLTISNTFSIQDNQSLAPGSFSGSLYQNTPHSAPAASQSAAYHSSTQTSDQNRGWTPWYSAETQGQSHAPTSPTRKNQVLDELYCPITGQLMNDPVIAADGFTYERSAIKAWLSKPGTSPMTNTPLTCKMLIPNRAVKSMIDTLLATVVCASYNKQQQGNHQKLAGWPGALVSH